MLLVFALASPAQMMRQENVDLHAIHKIKEEALTNSKVMETLFYLTDVNGHRLTGSAEFKRSADWTLKRLKEFGIENARLEKFPFGKGWTFSRFSMHMTEPSIMPVIGYPMAWTPGTNGPVTAEVVYAPMTSPADMQKWKGKLKDKIVLIETVRDLALPLAPFAKRHSASDLEEMLNLPEPGRGPGGAPAMTPEMLRAMGLPPGAPAPTSADELRQRGMALRNERNKFLKSEGVLAVLTHSTKGEGGTVFGTSYGSQDPKQEVPPTAVAIAGEHYARMVRLVNAKVPVKVELDVKAQMIDEPQDGFNVIAELPGTGPNKDEYVLIGGHLDSWQGATGATDNAAACAIMIETLRLFKNSGLKLNRSVRIGLWGGEEQGLLGSRAYVKDHLADRENMVPKSEHGKIAAYFNIDNGAGKIRGIYTQSNEMVRPVFEQWMAPLKDMGVTTITNRNTSGTDHLAFDEVGVPGFQFIQDPMDYSPRTHHSNMDTYDRVQRADMLQMVAVVGTMVYHAANRDEKLPRKPMPKPRRQPDPAKTAAPASSGAAQ